jgi:hypothetical protein
MVVVVFSITYRSNTPEITLKVRRNLFDQDLDGPMQQSRYSLSPPNKEKINGELRLELSWRRLCAGTVSKKSNFAFSNLAAAQEVVSQS